MSRTIALLVAAVLGAGCNGLELPTSPQPVSLPPGESLVVTWSGPTDPSDFGPPDVIGLYAVDDPANTALWTTTSGVGDRFSAQFEAPLRRGVYEVRYHMLSQYLLAKAALVVR